MPTRSGPTLSLEFGRCHLVSSFTVIAKMRSGPSLTLCAIDICAHDRSRRVSTLAQSCAITLPVSDGSSRCCSGGRVRVSGGTCAVESAHAVAIGGISLEAGVRIIFAIRAHRGDLDKINAVGSGATFDPEAGL